MNRLARRLGVGRVLSAVALVAVVGLGALLLAMAGRAVPPPQSAGDPPRAAALPPPTSGSADPAAGRSTYTLVQMNLCLSGVADCYGAAAYPAVVDEAVSRLQEVQPDAVTVNEVCRDDGVAIARRLGLHVRFAPVDYDGGPFPCVNPGSRGLFGHAVLTKQPIAGSETGVFTAQADLEERRWLCVTTRDGLEVCTAHLETSHSAAASAANEAQCAELADVLARRVTRRVVFGGDVNRRAPCAPARAWSRTDVAADQTPGVQHVYGSAALGSPVTTVVPSTFSDHDMLVVRVAVANGRR